MATLPASSKVTPGAVLLFQGNGLTGWCIRFAQWCRPSLRPYRKYVHAAIAVSETDLVEAVFPRVRRRRLKPGETATVIDLRLTPGQAQRASDYALSCVGVGYGLIDVLCFGFTLMTGRKLPLLDRDDCWCSECVLRSLQAGGIELELNPSDSAPASLALALGVKP